METRFLPFSLGSLIAILAMVAAFILALTGELHWTVAGLILALGFARLV